jgi:hypothetical protein
MITLKEAMAAKMKMGRWKAFVSIGGRRSFKYRKCLRRFLYRSELAIQADLWHRFPTFHVGLLDGDKCACPNWVILNFLISPCHTIIRLTFA